MNTRKKILIVRLGAMGDILFTTPAIRALKHQFPESHITYLTMRKWAFLLKNNPSVDRVFGIRYRQPRSARALWREKFDLIVNLHEFEDGARICESIPAMERRGNRWSEEKGLIQGEWSQLLGKAPAIQSELSRRNLSYGEIYCHIAGVEPDSFDFDFCPGFFAVWRAWRFLRRRRLLTPPAPIALHLHSRGSEAKSWSTESALGLVRRMKKQRFLVLGYKEDRERTRALEGESNVVVSYHNVTAQAEMLLFCAAFVGIDSGPRQLAAAMGIPVITLFGPTPPEFLPPKKDAISLTAKVSCAPCYAAGDCREGRQCLDFIGTDEIAKAVERALERPQTIRQTLEEYSCPCMRVSPELRRPCKREARRLRMMD